MADRKASGSNNAAAGIQSQTSQSDLGTLLGIEPTLSELSQTKEELHEANLKLSEVLMFNARLQLSNDILKQCEAQLKGSELQYKVANEQLTADNEQLTVDNRQLTADNEQLTAENEKLRGFVDDSTVLLERGTERLKESQELHENSKRIITSLIALFRDSASPATARSTLANAAVAHPTLSRFLHAHSSTPETYHCFNGVASRNHAMNPTQMIPVHPQGVMANQPHPVEAMYMARIAAKRWQESPWSQGGRLPAPVNMPAPNLSIEEMLELQELVHEYDTALRGEDEVAVHDHGEKTAKRSKTSDRKGKKVVTIAASDSSSATSDTESDDNGEGPSAASGSQSSGAQQQQQPPPATSAHYYEHVLARQFPPRRSIAADEHWSESDCRILAVIEAKYDMLRYQQYQSDFFNATGRMVPAYLIQAKMNKDARTVSTSSPATHETSFSSTGSFTASAGSPATLVVGPN